MNELDLRNNGISSVSDTALSIYKFCASVTPAIYKNKQEDDILAEIESIKLLCSTIETPVLEEMCRQAVKSYPLKKADNHKCVFDFNYILEFYEKAYSKVFGKKKGNCFMLKSIDEHEDYYIYTWKDPETGEEEESRVLRR